MQKSRSVFFPGLAIAAAARQRRRGVFLSPSKSHTNNANVRWSVPTNTHTHRKGWLAGIQSAEATVIHMRSVVCVYMGIPNEPEPDAVGAAAATKSQASFRLNMH